MIFGIGTVSMTKNIIVTFLSILAAFSVFVFVFYLAT